MKSFFRDWTRRRWPSAAGAERELEREEATMSAPQTAADPPCVRDRRQPEEIGIDEVDRDVAADDDDAVQAPDSVTSATASSTQ